VSDSTLHIWADAPGATIHPNIYGHFAEHLGRCIYEGIWVGEKSRIPNDRGIRLDVLAALKQVRAPIVRWPGGCFADTYHWRHGIGNTRKRHETVDIFGKQTDPNSFGTDEFIRFCNATGAQPYITLNVGTGSPAEALQWWEYCNFGGDSKLSKMRAANGSAKPYDVRYWGVGNESWGCGGRFTAQDYAKEDTLYASLLRAADPEAGCIACGCSPMDYRNPNFVSWNHDFCKAMPHADLIDHLSIHRYFARGGETDFSDSMYQNLFADLITMERDIQQADQLLSYFYPDKFVGLAIDEWGVWHPTATVENGLEQANTLRDAVFAGAALNLFNRYAHRITMANLAQTVNVLQCLAVTEGGRMFLTPTYYVYDMMRVHMNTRMLRFEMDGPSYEAHPIGLKRKQNVPFLSASASLAGNTIFLTVANQTTDQDVESRVELHGAKAGSATGRILVSNDPRDVNSFDNPKTIVPKRIKPEIKDGELVHVFPAHSVTSLKITLE